MANKITETDINGNVTILLDTSQTTATPETVGNGKVFVDRSGQYQTGNATVYKAYAKPKDKRNIFNTRYRVIPTFEEFKLMRGNNLVDYNHIIPMLYYNSSYLGILLYSDYLTEFTNVLNEYYIPVYDNKYRGWVVGSCEINTPKPSYMTQDESDCVNTIWNEIKVKYSTFVFCDEFIRETNSFSNGEVVRTATANNGVSVRQVDDYYIWYKLDDDLGGRLKKLIYAELKLLIPEIKYELIKFKGKGAYLEGVNNIDLESLILRLSSLRTQAHIHTSTNMRSANTPEVVENLTPDAVISKYLSSVFNTETEREAFVDDVWTRFNDTFGKIVDRIAYKLFLVNMG